MRAGERRHTITIQTPTTTTTKGVSTTTWATFKAGVPASIETLRSWERANVNTIWPGADVMIKINYITGVTGNMRITDEDGNLYTIMGKPNDIDGRHREIEMTCQTGSKGA